MLQSLPKQLTKRKIVNPKSQKDIQAHIANQTLELLQDDLNSLRRQLNDYIHEMTLENDTIRQYFIVERRIKYASKGIAR
ncbi:Uncharacterised protein [Mycobacteroides abscessus subsp. massiliense]|nr:Uncharacterised protein [Mycobacteroides abscessus subsp. massiliense]